MATSSVERARPGWRFWLLWMFATIAGVFLYMIVFPPVFNAISERLGGTRGEVWIGMAIGATSAVALGATIGVAQWFGSAPTAAANWMVGPGNLDRVFDTNGLW